MPKKYMIVLPSGYVTGFDEEHQIVQVTEQKSVAFHFTLEEVEEFIDQYADCGYGIASDDYTLEDVAIS